MLAVLRPRAWHSVGEWSGQIPRLVVMCAVVVLLSACSRSGPARRYTLLDLPLEPLPKQPPRDFLKVAWVRPTVLALLYDPPSELDYWDNRLMIYDMATGEYEWVPEVVPPECADTAYLRLRRLPNRQLGYVRECAPRQGVSVDTRLYVWNLDTHTEEEIYRYPRPFQAWEFSFAPRMDRWLQEQPVGARGGPSEALYLMEKGKPPERLLANTFDRAEEPVWLSDGRILLAGTPRLPETKPNLFSGLPALTAILDAPSNIYLTDLESMRKETVGEEQIVLSGVVWLTNLRASPDERCIAFNGKYDGHYGLWVYGLQSGRLVRLFAYTADSDSWWFDWSPVGPDLVVMEPDPAAGDLIESHPKLLKLPEELQPCK